MRYDSLQKSLSPMTTLCLLSKVALIMKAIMKMFLIIKAIMILTIKKNYHQACSAVGCCSEESSEVPLICKRVHSWFSL